MSEPTTRPGGKGRPTPKRSAAKRSRTQRAAPPKNRKEALARQREQQKAEAARRREALLTGDEANMPEYFRGPEKAAVRDAVDARPSLGWLAFPALLTNVAALLLGNTVAGSVLTTLSLLVMLVVLFDALRARQEIKRVLAVRFPAGTKERAGQLVRYGLARNFQRRTRRKPRPKVDIGAEI